MPISVKGKVWKLVRPFHGPYRVLPVSPIKLMIKYDLLTNQKHADAVFVSQRNASMLLQNLMYPGVTAANHIRTKSKAAAKMLLLQIK